MQTNFLNKKFTYIKSSIIAIAMALITSGCSMSGFDLSSMMKPPRPIGEAGNIQAKIESTYRNEVLFKCPNSGEYRSSIVLHDMTGDGQNEGIAFYNVNGSDENIHITILKNKNSSEWNQVADFSTYNSDIDKIFFWRRRW